MRHHSIPLFSIILLLSVLAPACGPGDAVPTATLFSTNTPMPADTLIPTNTPVAAPTRTSAPDITPTVDPAPTREGIYGVEVYLCALQDINVRSLPEKKNETYFDYLKKGECRWFNWAERYTDDNGVSWVKIGPKQTWAGKWVVAETLLGRDTVDAHSSTP